MSEHNAPEQRTIDVDVENLDARGKTAHGYAAVYDVLSEDLGGFKERISRGAFSGVLPDSDVRALLNHDANEILGRTRSGTLRLFDEERGLRFELDLPDSPLGENVKEAIRRKDIDGASFRFVIDKESWQDDVRTVESVKQLQDITLATYPAYPAASVELRTRPPRIIYEPAEERAKESNMEAEDRSSEERRGSLDVEAHKVESRTEFDFVHEVAEFARDVKRGETRSLTTAISLSNPEFSTAFFDLLRPRSVFLASGVPIISTESDSLIYPKLSSDAVPGWYAEGDTITASDPGFTAGTATPRKLAVRTEYSNEVADDSDPALEGVLRNVLAGRAATLVDIAAFEGTGSGNQPSGMGNIAGIGNVNAAGLSTGSVLWAGTAIATLEGAAAPRPYTYVGGTSLVRRLREVRVGSGGNVDEFLFPPTSEEVPSLWGATGRLAPHLNGGTSYFYSPSSCYLVNRIAQFDIEVDRSRLFHQDMSEMRVKARLDFAYPYPGTIVRGTAVPA